MAKKKSATAALDEVLALAPHNAFRVLDVGETLGYKLINHGILERIYITGEPRITIESVRRVAREGTPKHLSTLPYKPLDPDSPPRQRRKRRPHAEQPAQTEHAAVCAPPKILVKRPI